MTDSDELMDALPGFSTECHKKRDYFEFCQNTKDECKSTSSHSLLFNFHTIFEFRFSD